MFIYQTFLPLLCLQNSLCEHTFSVIKTIIMYSGQFCNRQSPDRLQYSMRLSALRLSKH